jgi:hypothetical protein
VRGKARHRRHGATAQGAAGYGLAGKTRPLRRDRERQGTAGTAGTAWLDGARQGVDGLVSQAWLVLARPGKTRRRRRG